jgi:hypothetical protein
MSYNDITGDRIKSRTNTKLFNDNFDRIFRKKDKKDDGAEDNESENLENNVDDNRCSKTHGK